MQASLFVEEMASILLTPFVLYFSLPYCTDAILDFVRDHTVFVEGVGDICSLANFDFEKHGNSKYGANAHSAKVSNATVSCMYTNTTALMVGAVGLWVLWSEAGWCVMVRML